MVKTCPKCKTRFQSLHSQQVYCSPECKREAARDSRRKRRARSRPPTCFICGRDISHKRRGTKVCDSPDCQRAWRRHRYANNPEERRRKGVQNLYAMRKIKSMEERLVAFKPWADDPWSTLSVPGAGVGPSPEATPLENLEVYCGY